MLTNPPSRTGSAPVVSNIGMDNGYIYDLGSKYYSVSRDGSTMYYLNGIIWTMCESAGVPKSYAYYRANQTILRISWSTGSQDAFTISSITNDCTSTGYSLLKTVPLWVTNAGSFALNTIKATAVNNDLHLELPSSVGSKNLYSVYYPFLNRLQTAGLPYIMKVGIWGPIGSVGCIIASTVFASNNFTYLVQSSSGVNVTSANISSQLISNYVTSFSNVAAITPIVRGKYPSFVNNGKEFPTYDAFATVPSDLVFQYHSSTGIDYNFDFNTMSYTNTTSGNPVSVARYYYKDTIIDTVTTAGSVALSLYLLDNLTIPYYTTTRANNRGLTPVYWSESVLYITNDLSSFMTISDGFTPQQFEFNRYFQINGDVIIPYCSTTTNITSIFVANQGNLVSQPQYQLSISNKIVDGIKYVNFPKAVIQFDRPYVYDPTSIGFTSSLSPSIPANPTVGSAFVQVTFTPPASYDNVTFGNGTMTISNECKSLTISGGYNAASNSLRFAADARLFGSFKNNILITNNASALGCSDSWTSNTTTSGVPFTDYYLDNSGFGSLSASKFSFDSNTQQMRIDMPDPFLNTMKDYKLRNFALNITLRGQRCGNDLLMHYDATAVNLNAKQLQFSVDSASFGIKTTYSMSISVLSPDGSCRFTSNVISFNAGSNHMNLYPSGPDWLYNYYYSSTGKFVLNTTNSFRTAIQGLETTFTSLAVDIGLSGCPASTILNTGLGATVFDGTFQVIIPANFNGSKYYMNPSARGVLGSCSFQVSAYPSPFQVNGTVFKDAGFNTLKANASTFSINAAKMLFWNMSSMPIVLGRLSYYLNINNGFQVNLAINGTTFPLVTSNPSKQTIPLTSTSISNSVLSVDTSALLTASCKQSLTLEFQIQSTTCDYMVYGTGVTIGNGIYSAIGSELFTIDAFSNEQTVFYVNNNVLRLPFSLKFQQTFAASVLSLNAKLAASTCGQQLNASQSLELAFNNTLLANQTYLDFTLTPQYYDTFALYNINMNGVADTCQFSLSNYVFKAGSKGSVDAKLNGLNINGTDIQFISPSNLKIANQQYVSQISSYSSGGSTIVQFVKADTCPNKFDSVGASGSNQFTIPADFFNSTVQFTLQTNIQSGDCQLSTNFTFNAGFAPSLKAAYYNFGNIEILGANLGSNSGVCTRNRTILLSYANGTNVTSGSVILWNDGKIIFPGIPAIVSVTVKIGVNTVTTAVSRPFFAIDTFLNNEITFDGLQKFTFALDTYGFDSNEKWVIDTSNELYNSFLSKNGSMSDQLTLHLPANKIAKDLTIYFYIGPYKVPGLICINIRRTPIITGQNLSPTIELLPSGNYQFGFRVPDVLRYSLVDYSSITNSYKALPEHLGLAYDSSNVLMYPIPQKTVSQYDINAKFNVVSDAAVGQTVLNNLESGTTTSIGYLSIINGVEKVTFINQNITWAYDNQNTKILKVGDFPLMVNLTFIDTKKQALSIASFSIVASLICPSGQFPNVFGQTNDNKISLCATCPDGATCSATGTGIPQGKTGYYELNNNGVYVYAPCIPAEACQGSSICSTGYSI